MTGLSQIDLSALSDDPTELPEYLRPEDPRRTLHFERASPRLKAVTDALPKQSRVRVANAIWSAGVVTLEQLCAARRADTLRWKNFGRRGLDALVATLALFGLALHEDPPVSTLDFNAQHLLRWIQEHLTQLDALGVSEPVRAAHERDLLADVMLVLDGRSPMCRRTAAHAAPLVHEARCTQIADLVVPTFRVKGRRTGSCGSPSGKRWQAAWDGACIALGKSPADFRKKTS